MAALRAVREHVKALWHRTLKRRSQRDKRTWERLVIAEEWPPEPSILHPWPSSRFAVKHPRREPSAGVPPVRSCAGGPGQPGSLPQSVQFHADGPSAQDGKCSSSSQPGSSIAIAGPPTNLVLLAAPPPAPGAR